MAISVGGLMSGLDTDSIIQQLVTLERRPITQLQRKEADFQLQLSTYAGLQGVLNSLNTAIEGLDKADDFTKFKATSADSDIFTVSTGSDAVNGSYNITVHNLAQVHKLTSSGYGATDNVGEGTLTLQVGAGTEMTIDVAADDTLRDVADAINAEKGNVTAGVIFDGTHYFLALTATETGEANTIKITANDTGDGNHTDINGLSRLAYEKGATENTTMVQTQEALDATIDVDGITGIKRASNVLNDVITGVTITLVKAHDSPATDATALTVGRDTNSIVAAVDAFVGAYNGVVDFLSKNQSFDKASGIGGPLLGDATAKLIQRRLSALLNMNHAGMVSVSRLSDIGLTRGVNGKLTTATSTLTEKLTGDLDGVVRFFTQTTDGAEGFAVRMTNELNGMLDTFNGTLSARQKGIQKSIDGIQNNVERIEMRIAATEARMRAQFNALELLLGEYQATGNYLSQQISGLQNLNAAIANR